MALLPQDPRRQSMLLVIVIAIAAAALFFVYVYRPGTDRLLELSDRIEDLETQNQIAEKRIGNLQELRDRLSAAERQFESLEKLVPSGAEVPEIYEAIATETQALNLRLISVEPSPAVEADTGSYFMRQHWDMIVEGDYHSIGEFLTRVASFERIVRPEITELVPSEVTPSGRQLVTATFGLETFVLVPGDPVPSAEEDE